MSQKITKDMPLGGGQVYWNNVRIGTAVGDSVVHYEAELATRKRGEDIGESVARIIKETASVDITLGDIKIEQLRYAFGRGELSSSVPLVSATASTSLRKAKQVKMLASGTAVSLSETSITNLVVSKPDFSVEYIKTTDYTASLALGTITRIGAGAISSGSQVVAAFNFTDASAAVIKMGGLKGLYEAELKVVFTLSDGKLLQFKAGRAVRVGAVDITVPEDDYASIPLSFKLLNDVTKPKGEQLYEWAIEA